MAEKSPAELRRMAAQCREQAREASPNRARQLRRSAGALMQQARRLELFQHAKEVGRSNVTLASFREHLRGSLA
jgi:hypothetical protein